MSGGPEASPVMTKLVELLEEKGGEAEWEWLIREAGKVIPPGRAMRKAELIRRGARGVTPPERVRPASEDRLIASGRRSIVVATMQTMPLERREDEEGRRWVKLLAVPPSVARDRARARAHHQFDPADIADEIAGGRIAISALLDELSQPQLRRVALELAKRERQRATIAEHHTEEG